MRQIAVIILFCALSAEHIGDVIADKNIPLMRSLLASEENFETIADCRAQWFMAISRRGQISTAAKEYKQTVKMPFIISRENGKYYIKNTGESGYKMSMIVLDKSISTIHLFTSGNMGNSICAFFVTLCADSGSTTIRMTQTDEQKNSMSETIMLNDFIIISLNGFPVAYR